MYYELYQKNIKTLIKDFELKYYWYDINKTNFYNGTKALRPWKYEGLNNDPWLSKYKTNKIELAKDILQNGTFTPFFYWNINGKKYINLGKHRIYSLKLYCHYFKINRKFLFIELPIDDKFKMNNKRFLYDFNYEKIEKRYCLNNYDMFCILCTTGDFLTHYFWENKTIPFDSFNNEQKFEEWLSNE